MELQEIVCPDASPALGPYCHGRKFGDLIVTSGQIPLTKDGKYVFDIKDATKVVLGNLLSIVKTAGGSLERVAKVDVYLRDLADFNEMNEAYAEFFGTHRPARVCVQISALPKNVPMEMSMMAFAKDGEY